MASEYEKGEVEINVFRQFVELSGLPIDLASIQKRLPPEPDLLCFHKIDGWIAFELVEICDSNLAKFMAQSNEGYLRTSDPSHRVISKKLSRSYECSAPIELLCYVGRVITPEKQICLEMEPCFNEQEHPFRRAWLLGRKELHLVWESSSLK
jgi:hypothetical protein